MEKLYGSNEAVAASRQCFDKSRGFFGVTQGVPKPLNGTVQTDLVVHKSVARPQSSLELIPHDHLAGMLQEQGEDLERLVVEFDFHAVLAKLAGAEVQVKTSELGPAG
jgi:hypothetical protein